MHQREVYYGDNETKLFFLGAGVLWRESYISLMLTPEDLEDFSDQEIVSLCRWFQRYSKELGAIEFVREHGALDQYGYGEENILDLAQAVGDPWIREQLLGALAKHKEGQLAVQKLLRARAKPKTQVGYVYVVKGGGYYKIGYSANPDSRIASLNTQPPFGLEIIRIFEVADMRKFEAWLHEQFADKRVQGEWFELDDEDIDYIMNLEEL